MKTLLILALAVATVLAADQYTTKYDNIDLDQILKSERLLKNYFDCIMERGNCTPDGKELKANLPDALKTDCAKCSEKQRNGTKKVIKFLVKSKRDLFDELATKYDPEHTYINAHREELAKEGVVV